MFKFFKKKSKGCSKNDPTCSIESKDSKKSCCTKAETVNAVLKPIDWEKNKK